jgi:ribosomal protein L37AE/L43A
MNIYKWTIYCNFRFPFIHIFENNYSLNKEIEKAIKSIKGYSCPNCKNDTKTLSEYNTYLCTKCGHETWGTHEREAERRGRELQNTLDIISAVSE